MTLAAVLQSVIEWTDQEVTAWEAVAMVIAWPILVFVFVWYFVKGMLS